MKLTTKKSRKSKMKKEMRVAVETVSATYRGGYGYFCHSSGICPCLPCNTHFAQNVNPRKETWGAKPMKGVHYDARQSALA